MRPNPVRMPSRRDDPVPKAGSRATIEAAMTLLIRYPVENGNTVPYPPLFDDIRRNHGFVDLRERPGLVDGIPEAARSPALHAVLRALASPGSPLMSLGCDLGSHERKEERPEHRHRSGGYLQVALLPLSAPDRELLLAAAKVIADRLGADVGGKHWFVDLALCATKFEFGPALTTQTLWIWFDAAASTRREARLSRERLIASLGRGLRERTGRKDGQP